MSKAEVRGHFSLEYLKKLAKDRLRAMREQDPAAKLADAQLAVAREQGFTSWRALRAQHEESRTRQPIASPAMRFIAVSDLDRSVAFYRDLLGFTVTRLDDSAEAVLGPARIRLGKDGYAAADWSLATIRPPGSLLLFLECRDVESLHAQLLERGASPSGIEKVNWIKMRMFEVRDPDGNVLWFGESYHEQTDNPSRRKAQPRGLRQALPEMPFNDVGAAVDYYCRVFGFRINYQQHDLGVVYRDAITVLLIQRTERHTGIGSFEVYVEDAGALYEELLSKGAGLDGPPVSHPWGLRDFRATDLEGNRITFAQTFE